MQSDVAHLEIVGDLPGFRLTAAINALFGIDQDWLHQKTDIHWMEEFIIMVWEGEMENTH